jgi:Tol biopolymer transport system component
MWKGNLYRSSTEGSSERVKEVKWLSDNKTLLFSQTLGGYANFYTIAADGSTVLKQITSDKKNNRSLVMNKKRTKAVYLSGRDEVRILDTKALESKTIVKDEIWGFQGSNPGFSPEADYVFFTAFRNFEQDIFVYNIKENKTINLTKTGVNETSPFWSADGKYIYLTSQRLKPSYPFGMPDAKVYRMPLEKLDEPFRMDKYNDLFKEEKKIHSKKRIHPR